MIFNFLNTIHLNKTENTRRNKCSAKVYTVGQNIQLINTDKSCFDHSHASDENLK